MSNEYGNGGWAMDDYNGNNETEIKKVKLPGCPTEFSTLYKAEIAVLVSLALTFLSVLFEAPLFMTVSFLALLAASIVFLVFVMKLNHYSNDFRMAGICYLVYFILYFFHNNFVGFLRILIEAAYFIFLMIYIVKFSNACTELLKNKDKKLAESWDVYKTVVLFTYALAIICDVLIYVPVLNVIASAVLTCIFIARLGFVIWHIMLLKQTDAAIRLSNSAA